MQNVDSLQLLADYTRQLQQCKNQIEVSNMAVQKINEILETDVAYIKLNDINRRIFKTIAGKGFKYFDINNYPKSEMPMHAGMAGYVVKCKRTISNTDYSHSSLPFIPYTYQAKIESFQSEELRSIIATPLMSQGVCIGVLFAAMREKVNFNETQRLLLEIIAQSTATVLMLSHFTVMQKLSAPLFNSNDNMNDICFSQEYLQKYNMLTEREKEVLMLLSQGLPYLEISKQLFISVNTVRFHIQNLKRKLDPQLVNQ